MPDAWTGDLVGRMHNARVTLADLAAEMGVTVPYVSMLLNSKRTPDGAEKRLNDAFERVVNKRNGKEE